MTEKGNLLYVCQCYPQHSIYLPLANPRPITPKVTIKSLPPRHRETWREYYRKLNTRRALAHHRPKLSRSGR